jgi:peptidyl-prolyl cis-trans isomerase B (cyclophilin B)
VLPPGCTSARPRPSAAVNVERPTGRLDPSKTWTLRLQTNCGAIAIRLAVRRSPQTTASVAGLVRRGFYDGLTFHRIANDPSGGPFVIQGGDPEGSGSGGPGYTVVEAPPRSASGSQFFIVTAADAGLPPDYAVLGTVTGDASAVARIAAAPAGPDERPRAPIVIERATVSSS